mmetsp:Transcript_4949/g.14434  ORF Transcript_4949/g.14434 Transcript_4949/m.14434 type:complete len:564 (-) Transcript_4949:75-1766(-)
MAISPAFMVLTYLGAFFLRKKLHNRERQKWIHQVRRFPVAVLLQPYTCLMAVFMLQYAYLVYAFARLFNRYRWLDPSTFALPDCTNEPNFSAEYEIPNAIRMLAMISPIFIGLTWVVTITHWAKHLPKNRGFDEDLRWYPTFSHDLAMQVVALPLVYGNFLLDSVLEMLRLLTGESFSMVPDSRVAKDCEGEWNRLKLQIEQTCQSNTQLADLYEAWALRCFGTLCFALVGRQINREVPTVKYILSTIKNHLQSVASAESGDRSILDDVKILTDPRNQLFKPLQLTSRIGVRVFVWTYAIKSVYLLVLTFLGHIDLQLCGEGGKFPPACSFLPYLDGACFLASTLAIYNIVVFEHNLNSILKAGHFRPFEKFLGVKVMVSICFIQSFVLEVLGSWLWDLSKEQISLCYSCLLCCEVLPLSLLLYIAWRPAEGDWHHGDLYDHLEPAEGDGRMPLNSFVGRGQLADEASTMFDDSLVFQKSRELSATLGPRPAFSDELTGIIELRGEVQAREAKALEDVINSLSKSMRAQYKPAALLRTMTPATSSGSGWKSSSRPLILSSSET